MSLRIALIGYGKMGRAVETAASARGHIITARIDRNNAQEIAALHPDQVQVAIEFTQPDTAPANFQALLRAGIPVVTGTTGWLSQLSTIQKLTAEYDGSFLMGSNFSVGMNLLFRLNRQLAEWMNAHPEFDPFVEERHHRHKKDAPGGSALTLANDILSRLDRKSKIASGELASRPPLPEELSVGFIRAGEITGYHAVTYTAGAERLSISHEALSRDGFASGAVFAAEWLHGKKGFYNFSDIFHS